MRASAQRLVWIIGLFCLAFGVAGAVALSPVTIALSITCWFLCRASIRQLSEYGDISAPSPHLQYWARNTLLRTVGLMVCGVAVAEMCVAFDLSIELSVQAQALLTVLLICTMIVVARVAIPGFFAASWEVHGLRERRKRERTSTVISRAIVRAVAALVLITSLVGSFAFLQSVRQAAPQYSRLAELVSRSKAGAPAVLEGLFSPSSSSTR